MPVNLREARGTVHGAIKVSSMSWTRQPYKGW